MTDTNLAQTIVNLKKELASIEISSHRIGGRFGMLQREAESLKIDFLKYSLEKQRKTIAYQRGLAIVIGGKRKMGTSLAIAVSGLVLGGLMTKDKYAALNAGLSGFDGTVQGFGETRWAVSLQNELEVVPYDAISTKGTWVTLESLIMAIHDLRTEALQGKRLGDLDNIIQRLRQSGGKLIYIAIRNRN
jgi:hypothetical protein